MAAFEAADLMRRKSADTIRARVNVITQPEAEYMTASQPSFC